MHSSTLSTGRFQILTKVKKFRLGDLGFLQTRPKQFFEKKTSLEMLYPGTYRVIKVTSSAFKHK